MKMRDFHWQGLTWALVLVPSLALSQAQWIPIELQTLYFPNTHKETGYTPADMVLQDGVGRTVIFEILNLTPYKIHYTDSSLYDQTNRDRKINTTFAFAPVGVPSVIPPGSTGFQGLEGIPGTHPRSFVIAWNDYPGTIEQTKLNWLLEGVDYLSCTNRLDPSTCSTEQMNVYLGLWMSRIAPPDPLKSAVIADVFNIVNEITSYLAFVLDPLNPLGWWAMFSSTYALVQDPGFLEQQTTSSDGLKMYVSAYPLPTFDRECFQKNNIGTWLQTGNTGEPDQYLSCTPGTRAGESSDGYKAQWADTDSGPAPAELVVLTSVVRGKKTVPSTVDYHPGSVAHVMITVMTATQYEHDRMFVLAQAPPPMAGGSPGVLDLEKEKVVKEIRKFRDKYGAEGRRAAHAVIAKLAPGQREYMSVAVHTLLQHRPISKAEEKFLLDLIKQSEKYIRDLRKQARKEG
jgi:hypothetical protein